MITLSTRFKNLRVSHLSDAFPSWEVALCIMVMTLVSGANRFMDFATPLNAGAKAECQKGKITRSISPSAKITLAVLRQELGEIESSGAEDERGGVDVPDFVWATPGKRREGY